jgi:HEAT repeat protein
MRPKYFVSRGAASLLGLLALMISRPEPSQARQFQATRAVSPKGAEAASSRPRQPAAQESESISPKERELITVLRSESPPEEKALACKQLAVYGSAEAVSALAPLLADEHLASWARIPLEAIPGPAADNALRQALDKLHGKLLVGVINSIGVRRDTKAVSKLIGKLKEPDTEVASAAAIALGCIADSRSASALTHALVTAPPDLRDAVAEGCVRCAEQLMKDEKFTAATKLYDTVRQSPVQRQAMLEATRGAILARRSAGIPLLLEQLRATDKARFGLGLRVARELPGREATDAVIAEMYRADNDRQPMLLLALADRTEPAVRPAILQAVRSGSQKMRLVAIGVLEHSPNLDSLPVLIEAAAGTDTDVAQAALGALTRFPGNAVEPELLGRLLQSTGRSRQVLIEVAANRRLEAALPTIVQSVDDRDAGIHRAALRAVGLLGSEKELASLIKLLLQNPSRRQSADIEAALLAISSRRGADCVPFLLPLSQSSESALRIVGLHALGAAGGPAALASVTAALEDRDDSVQEEAVRTLATWPNTWPEDSQIEEPLLNLARSTSRKNSYPVLALRGYLQFLQGDKKLSDEEKVTKLKAIMPLIKRSEEKEAAVAVLRSIHTASALELLAEFAADPGVAEEAWAAVIDSAGKSKSAIPKSDRQKALQLALEKCANDANRKKAAEALKRLD